MTSRFRLEPNAPRPSATWSQLTTDGAPPPALLAWLRATPPYEWPMTCLQDLGRSIRQLAADDTAAVVDFTFAELLAFSSLMLLRCQLHVEKRLADCDAYPGDRTHLPVDLEQEGWLARIERIARFVSELSATWARVRHVSQLNEGNSPRTEKSPGVCNGTPLAGDRGQAHAGQRSAGNGRCRRSQARFRFG